MFFRGWMVVCEGYSRWFIWFLGWDNKRVDAVHRYYQQQRWDWVFGSPQASDGDEWHEEDDEWDDGFDDPPQVTVRVVDGKVVECPTCGLPWDGSPTCEVCGHRFLPQAISHNRQARLN